MKNIPINWLFHTSFSLVGSLCLVDYLIPHPNGFHIDAEKAQTTIDSTYYNHNYAPANVTNIWWNDDYIIAKQVILQSINGGMPVLYEERFA